MQTTGRADCGRPRRGRIADAAHVAVVSVRSVQLLYLAYKNIFHKLRSSYKLVARIHYNAVHAPVATTGERAAPLPAEPRRLAGSRLCSSFVCLVCIFIDPSLPFRCVSDRLFTGCAGSGVVLQPEDRYPELLEQYRTYTEQQIQVTTRREQRAIGCTRITLCANKEMMAREGSKNSLRGRRAHRWSALLVDAVC